LLVGGGGDAGVSGEKLVQEALGWAEWMMRPADGGSGGWGWGYVYWKVWEWNSMGWGNVGFGESGIALLVVVSVPPPSLRTPFPCSMKWAV